MLRERIGRLWYSVRHANVSYVFGFLRQAFGRRISPEELSFRWYFNGPSRSVTANNVRVMLGGFAFETLKAIEIYTDRRSGYEAILRNRISSRFQLPLDEGYCLDDLRRLFNDAQRKYLDLIEAHSVALHFKGKDIPAGIFDDHRFGGIRLYEDLENAVKIFDKPPF